MTKIKQTVYGFLKGSFLVNDGAFRNWRFILFVVGLMLIMITSSHSSDKKVLEIAKLKKELKEKREEFVDTRSIVMKKKLESSVRKEVAHLDLIPSETPPQVIKVRKEK